MPFLIPAALAALSDVLILILQEHREEFQVLIHRYWNNTTGPAATASTDDETDGSDLWAVHNVKYLGFIAALRLLLLLFPLPYHSYTGTAIRFSSCYHIFYGFTLFAVLLHMLALSMVDPDSIATLAEALGTQDPLDALQQQMSRSCWWILLLSLLSVICHITMLIHVRSTAPSLEHMPYHALRNRKKKMVYYYASRRSNSRANDLSMSNGAMANQLEEGFRKKPREDPLMISTPPPPPPPLRHQDACPTSPIQKLSTQYDEFVSDIQNRISHLKQDWTHKLDDFTQRHLNIQRATNRIMGHHSHNNPLLPLTPFRVLLQLFAYQDVIDSGKLDAVFDMDHGQSLIFFVPQLLSFLLHGAYYESDPTKLEAWILEKCANHIHFAHRCYWFLRAWSLEEDYDQTETTIMSPTPNHSGLSLDNQPNKLSALAKSASQSSLLSPRATTNGKHSRNNSWSSLTGIHNSAQKLLPEERAAVEDLMLRVVQVGEASARILQYGPPVKAPQKQTKKRRGKRDKAGVLQPQNRTMSEPLKTQKTHTARHNDNFLFWDSEGEEGTESRKMKKSPSYTLVPELALTPEKEASLPIDPNTGFPSQRHLETLTATHRFGFMPWATALKHQECLKSAASEGSSALAISSSFQGTPRFLDALLAIADGLFLIPKEQRQQKLRQQLRALEVEMLPSNSVYVPISNIHHRVWRIVSDESIALNTKERVPCIILLEVIDYDSNKPVSVGSKDVDQSDDFSGEWSILSAESKRKGSLDLLRLELPKLNMAKKTAKGSSGVGSPTRESLGQDKPFSFPYYTLMSDMSEMEMVHQWRCNKRDPHRGESILDKMASSLPLDMARMKEKIHQLRGKQNEIFHDLLAMTHHQGDVGTDIERGDAERDAKNDSEVAAFLCNDVYEGSRILPNGEVNTGNNRDLSPERDRLNVAMGQWSSSVAERSKILIRGPEDKDSAPTKPEAKAQTQKVSYHRQDSNERHYGSTFEGRGQTSNVMDGRPPRTPSDGAITKGMTQKSNSFTKKPPQRVVFRENWQAKEARLRPKSAFGDHPGWRLLPILIKSNDDLRQEQLASQLIQRMAIILAREHVPVWLCPYEIIALTDSGGIIEAIPDTISLDSLKRNDPNFVDLNSFFHSHFGGNVDDLADAKSNFVESLAAYSIVTFLLQLKDRHNGNILLDNRGHLIHIDFGFFFLSSPGKNTGFESAPFKLTRDFVEVMGGPESHSFRIFRELCVRTFLVLRRHSMEIILLVEMLKSGNEDLPCFLGRPDDAIKGLRERFCLDLNDRACKEHVNSLIDESLENWRTNWYDRYQRYCVGVL